jgi:hypothetical protein
MVNITYIIYESLVGSQTTFKWCWQVHELDLGMVCPYPGIWGSTPRRFLIDRDEFGLDLNSANRKYGSSHWGMKVHQPGNYDRGTF